MAKSKPERGLDTRGWATTEVRKNQFFVLFKSLVFSHRNMIQMVLETNFNGIGLLELV